MSDSTNDAAPRSSNATPLTGLVDGCSPRLTELIQKSLTSADLNQILALAADIASEETRSEFSALMEVLEDQPHLVLRAGRGWDAGRVGNPVTDPEFDSLSKYTLAQRKAVQLKGVSTPLPGQEPTLFQRFGIVSGCSVPVEAEGRTYGVLGVYSTSLRVFDAAEKSALLVLAALVAGATERLRATAQLRLLQQTIDSASIPIFRVDAQRGITYANTAMCAFLGYERQDLLNMTLSLLLPDEGAEGWWESLDALQENASVSFEARMRKKDGFVVSALVTADRLASDDGVHAMIYAREIPFGVQAKAAPVLETRADVSTARSSGDSIMIIDGKGRILHLNAVCLALFDIPDGEHFGKRIDAVIPKDFAQALIQEASLVLRHSRAGVMEHETHLRGVPVWYRTRVDPIPAADGTAHAVLVTSHEIAAHKGSEKGMFHAAVQSPRQEAPDGRGDRPVKQDANIPVVLLVEDDLPTITYMTHLLKAQCKLVSARCAADMWDELQRHPVAAILMDISLRGNTDGLQLTRQIRESGPHASIPVIAVTAYASDEDRVRCLAAGCNAYFTKPIDARGLQSALIELLQNPAQENR